MSPALRLRGLRVNSPQTCYTLLPIPSKEPLMNIRCVVTGRDSSGKSIFAKDASVAPITLDHLPGLEFHRLWGSDSTPQLPSDGTPPPHPRYFPPAPGYRFGFFTIPPEIHSLADHPNLPAAFAELVLKLPGLGDVLE